MKSVMVLACLCGCMLAARAAAQTTITSSAVSVPKLAERMAALTPEKPAEYFALGEEVAAEAGDTATRDLARRLYILAFELDRKQSKPQGLGPSVCRALAALAGPEGDKRWLRAMALQLSEQGRVLKPGDEPAQRTDKKEVSDQTAFKLATALGRVRSGEGNKAKKDLALPEVRETLESYASVLEGAGMLNALQRLEKHIEMWPYCPECRGKHAINKNEGGTVRAMICPTCGGIPGPQLTQEEFFGHLRMESALLRGIHRLWSAQLLADGAQPLRDPDPNDLAPTYRIDAEATVYRDGQWVKPPKAAESAAPPAKNP